MADVPRETLIACAVQLEVVASRIDHRDCPHCIQLKEGAKALRALAEMGEER